MAHELSVSHLAERNHLAPSSAFSSHDLSKSSSSYLSLPRSLSVRRTRDRRRNRSRNHRPGRQITSYKKLLWVKHPFPDNYTDEKTFLDHLERGRRELYEFWPLVADSMVIVQQVCAVIVFVCCFSGVIQERVSSITVVGCGSICTGLGWIMWDRWTRRENRGGTLDKDSGEMPDNDKANVNVQLSPPPSEQGSGFGSLGAGADELKDARFGLGLDLELPANTGAGARTGRGASSHKPNASNSSIKSTKSPLASTFSSTTSLPDLATRSGSLPRPSAATISASVKPSAIANPTPQIGHLLSTRPQPPPPPTRATTLLTTLKSALLIHTTLLALSPLLKSLTKSTASDSIWALSICLMALNVFFFDYSSYVPPSSSSSSDTNTSSTTTAASSTTSTSSRASFPASLSTNAGLMASTVLASRLSDTLAVFSLTLFSIEVFGLFPVFRRVLHQRWWKGHVALTVLLVMGAGGGVAAVTAPASTSSSMGSSTLAGNGGGFYANTTTAAILSSSHNGSHTLVAAIGRWFIGAVLGGACALGSMGVAAWWLIGLQQYKDEMSGPWDVARPVLRRRWD